MPALLRPESGRASQDNLEFLRAYAERVVVEGGDDLTLVEDVENALIQEVWSASGRLKLSGRDWVVLMSQRMLPNDGKLDEERIQRGDPGLDPKHARPNK